MEAVLPTEEVRIPSASSGVAPPYIHDSETDREKEGNDSRLAVFRDSTVRAPAGRKLRCAPLKGVIC